MNQAEFHRRIKHNQDEDTIIMSWDKLSLDQLYQLQKEMQQELRNREELFHDELQLVN